MSSNSSDPRRSYSQRAGIAGIGAARPASTSSRKARVCGSSVASKAEPSKLPARVRREEVAVGSPAVAARSGATRALEHQLAAHELAVIFADGAGCWSEARVGGKGALRPFPHVAEHAAAGRGDERARFIELIAQARVGGGGEVLPFGCGWKPGACPARERIRFIEAHVRDGCRLVDLAAAA